MNSQIERVKIENEIPDKIIQDIVDGETIKDINEPENQNEDEKQEKDYDGDKEMPNEEENNAGFKYNPSKKRNYSKYDFVKIKVILEDHTYVFSRFLTSRVLTFVKVRQKDSIKITLILKKLLVETHKLELPQAELESYLFRIMVIKLI